MKNATLEGMVEVPAQTFLMGTDDAQASTPARPSHKVSLDGFFMDEAPVTNAQFLEFVEETSYVTQAEKKGASSSKIWKSYEAKTDHPVVYVSWNDALAYSSWAGKDLPTEAQWEAAARGGLEQKRFPWGNEPARSRAVFGEESTRSVKLFQPNGYGLFDMAGNVWELCKDNVDEGIYATRASSGSVVHNPLIKAQSDIISRRGGAWNVAETFRLENANRGAILKNDAYANLGFRCVYNASK